MEESEETINDEYGSYEIRDVEHHALHACGACLGVVASEEGQCETVLMESHPEEDDNGEDQTQADDAFCGLGRRESVFHFGLVRLLALALEDMAEPAFEGIVDGDADDERSAGYSKGEMVAVGRADAKVFLCPVHDSDSSCRGEHRTDIDSHVEE